ncbi:MAG: tetratricopeptide repeat protein [Akkermansiaceae bacterium]|nr:tetratricopeptide repeat protein [Akkermansiaceae bacterium]
MRAETLYADGKLAEAADAYRDIDPSMLSEKNRRGLLYQRGRCYESAGDHDNAAESLGEFIKQFPDDDRVPLARAARGRSLAATGANPAAIAEFDLVLQGTRDPALLTLAYLEGADLLRADNKLDAMVARCQAFLKARPTTDPAAIAKASYWAGWGLVKTNKGADAIALLENARELAPDAYAKHAGLLLCLVHLSSKNQTALVPEVALAIEKGYAGDLPEPLIRWAADQAFNGGDFANAARFYDLIADDENPELSPKEVWRFLGKSRLRTGDASGALAAIEHALKTEEDPAWKADGLADKANALLLLKRLDEATATVEEGLAMRPEGRIGSLLHMARGDILLAENKPTEAVRSYIIPVGLMDESDRSVRPLALHKLIAALEAAGQKADAEKYRQELQQKYPDWKP